jgi:hypothetical protein
MLVFIGLLLGLVTGLWFFLHQSKEEAEIIPVTEDLIIQKSSDTNIKQQFPDAESTQAVSPLEDLSESSSKTLKVKNMDDQDDWYFQKEAQRMIDKKLDSMFKPWWDWYYEWEKTIPDNSLSPSELSNVGDEMMFREPFILEGLNMKGEVVSSVIQKIPQCEKMEWQLKYYYEQRFLEKRTIVLDTQHVIIEKKYNKDF